MAKPQNTLNLLPERGERVLVCGQTGSGKTVAMATLAARLSAYERVAVLDSKIEPRYRRLPRSRLVRHASDFWAPETRAEKREGPSIAIWRPSPDVAQDPLALDGVLYDLYAHFSGTILIDELYPLHVSGKAGPGLTAILTRGRSRGITTIMGSQRPMWISRFCLSEAQHYWVYKLVDRSDRRRLSEVIPNYPVDLSLPRYYFYYYAHALNDDPLLFKPLPLSVAEAEETDEKTLDTSLRWV